MYSQKLLHIELIDWDYINQYPNFIFLRRTNKLFNGNL